MVTYSFDSNVLIDVLNDRAGENRNRLNHLLAERLGLRVCSLVVHELTFGAAISRRPVYQSELIRELLQRFRVEPLDEADARSAVDVRVALRREGLAIGPFDVLIAGQAIRRGWTMITRDFGEFGRIKGLAIESWPSVHDQRPPR
jgi:tRNA(fMet)-specific endonuclease VapC